MFFLKPRFPKKTLSVKNAMIRFLVLLPTYFLPALCESQLKPASITPTAVSRSTTPVVLSTSKQSMFSVAAFLPQVLLIIFAINNLIAVLPVSLICFLKLRLDRKKRRTSGSSCGLRSQPSRGIALHSAKDRIRCGAKRARDGGWSEDICNGRGRRVSGGDRRRSETEHALFGKTV